LYAALVLCVAPFADEVVASGTPVSGPITTTTWTKASSPYRVTNDINVPLGATLTIEPGVDVLFDDDVPFIVEGSLHAVGMQADSIRFLPGTAVEWGGLRIQSTSNDTSTLAYVRISGGNANGEVPLNRGGGLYLNTARLGMSHVVISGNRATARGGGLYITDVQSHVTLSECLIADNSTPVGVSNHGGGVYVYGSAVSLDHTVIARNSAGGEGGGLYGFDQATIKLIQCTVVGNSAATPTAGALRGDNGAQITVNSSIVWNSGGILDPDTCDVMYSVVEGAFAGAGNSGADPLFMNAAAGDYRLLPESPCINTADPSLGADPDGTRADMGAFAYVNPSAELVLPRISAHAALTVLLPITATVADAYGADLAFIADTNLVESVRLSGTAWDGSDTTRIVVSGDTVFVSIASAEKRTLTNAVLAELSITIRADAPVGTVALTWVPGLTNVNEQPVTLRDGSLEVLALLYGDVTGDGSLSGLDAAEILKYRVRLRPTIDRALADVTGNGDVSHLDAALVLYKILHPEYLFPVLGGFVPKVTHQTPRTLSWERDGGSWLLVTDNAEGIMGGDVTIRISGAPGVIAPEGVAMANNNGGLLGIAFARGSGDGRVLLRVETGQLTTPEMVSAELNEGAFSVLWRSAPRPASLAQNVPNPFNPTTSIAFTVPEAQHVRLSVYTLDGRLVRVLTDGIVEAGAHRVEWDGRDHLGRESASGTYVYQMTAGGEELVHRMLLVR
jgi:hypothetical protein